MVTVVVQVNGKVREQAGGGAGHGRGRGARLALRSAKVQAAMEGREPKKWIYVPGRLAKHRGIALSMKIAPVASRHVVRRIAWLIIRNPP